jgi:hypothetical protein
MTGNLATLTPKNNNLTNVLKKQGSCDKIFPFGVFFAHKKI